MKRLIVYLGVVTAVIGGCTSANISKNLSSGAIGCQPKDIEIIDETATATGLHNWVALCKNKRFICSYHSSTGVNCKELIQ